MLKFFTDFKKKSELRRKLCALYAEVDKNLEACYVMQQRGVLEKFRLEGWQEGAGDSALALDEKISTCYRALEDYNRGMADFKEFEQWYAADLNNKTPENARLLHAKKELVSEKFKGLLAVVKPTQEVFKARLIAQKIYKDKRTY